MWPSSPFSKCFESNWDQLVRMVGFLIIIAAIASELFISEVATSAYRAVIENQQESSSKKC